MSVRLWNLKDGGSQNARFLPMNRTFKVNFLGQKSTELKKNSFNNISLGDHFFIKHFSLNFVF